MDHLTIDTVPLATVSAPTGAVTAFVVRVDERSGSVTLDSAPAQ
ncbi:hypothetical protein ACLBWP_09320 [Microbacterium sp. M1A1_1b]|nr:hypothetical protein [Curtobacterium sp. VKM Ac-2922]